mmetsp:Transcript_7190/g.23013  ORF Transcript_7190/g.23013 Transcript_7190/m.23013 type:complete len:282 (+) Transcript_7190:761-1606(+)
MRFGVSAVNGVTNTAAPRARTTASTAMDRRTSRASGIGSCHSTNARKEKKPARPPTTKSPGTPAPSLPVMGTNRSMNPRKGRRIGTETKPLTTGDRDNTAHSKKRKTKRTPPDPAAMRATVATARKDVTSRCGGGTPNAANEAAVYMKKANVGYGKNDRGARRDSTTPKATGPAMVRRSATVVTTTPRSVKPCTATAAATTTAATACSTRSGTAITATLTKSSKCTWCPSHSSASSSSANRSGPASGPASTRCTMASVFRPVCNITRRSNRSSVSSGVWYT